MLETAIDPERIETLSTIISDAIERCEDIEDEILLEQEVKKLIDDLEKSLGIHEDQQTKKIKSRQKLEALFRKKKDGMSKIGKLLARNIQNENIWRKIEADGRRRYEKANEEFKRLNEDVLERKITMIQLAIIAALLLSTLLTESTRNKVFDCLGSRPIPTKQNK